MALDSTNIDVLENMEFVPGPAIHRVLCADCGTPIVPNSANLCVSCLRNTVDITEGIPKQGAWVSALMAPLFSQRYSIGLILQKL